MTISLWTVLIGGTLMVIVGAIAVYVEHRAARRQSAGRAPADRAE